MSSAPNSSSTPTLAERPDLFRRLVDTISDYAIFALDANGCVATWSRGAARIKGYAADEILGKHFSVFYTEDAIARGWPNKELEIARTQGSLEDEGWRVRKDGSRFWANVVITALTDDDGQLLGFAKVTRDITDKMLDARKLRRSEETFRLLVQSVKDYAIFMLDPSGKIISWNGGAEQIKGYLASEVIGRHFSLFYLPEDVAAGKPATLLKRARNTGTVHDEGWRVRKDGSVFWANVTVTAVYDRHGQLRGFAKVTRDMTERKRLEELETSARRMNEFLATLAHELRNPLAPLRTATDVVELAPGDEGVVRRHIRIVARQLTHMTRLVDDLLDIGRIAAGKMELHRSFVPLRDIIAAALEGAEPSVHEKAQRTIVSDEARHAEILADPMRLSQVLQNLLLNASKFSPAGTAITVRVKESDRSYLVEVSDEGCGIDPGALDDIFNLFVQERRPGSSAVGGLGIGLSLCRYIVEMHGGSIFAASAGPGRGSTFTVRIPRVADLQGIRPTEARDPRKPARVSKVLIVDDNNDAAASMKVLLELLGHEVQIAFAGREALKRVEFFVPEVALLDLAMPDMDGFELIESLHKVEALSGTRFYALTGFSQAEVRRKVMDAGFHGHLVKPVDLDALTKVFDCN